MEALEPVFREQGAAAVSLPINKAEVISQFISYGIGLFLGRYRLDKPGLNIAHPNPTEEEIRWGISGNLCRCTGYNNIVKAVQQAATEMQKES